ncbi:MAG: sulfotransferase, partial [Planctomycetota bacterium]
ITVVNVVAVSYSGSTWLNLVLGSHSEAFSVGEIDRLLKWGKTWCTFHGADCEYWSRFDLNSDENFFVQLHNITGKRVFVVNNTRKFLDEQNHPRIKKRFVWVIRDGRAVMASTLRKYPDQSNWQAARGWARAHKKKHKLFVKQPESDRLCVQYERLQSSQGEHVQQMCDLIGIEYEPEMLEFWKKPHCFIAGNGGPIIQVADYQGIDLPKMDGSMVKKKHHDNRAIYKQQGPADFKDERWKSELDDKQLRTFALAAGMMNRAMGYPKSTDRRGLLELD